jgi:hypothetical protein
MISLEEEAIALLLRSPRLEVSTIIDLMDVSDRDFRDMVRRNARIADLLAARSAGTLDPPGHEPAQCPVCDDWFVPYARARFCSDTCREVDRVSRPTRRPRPALAALGPARRADQASPRTSCIE